MIEYHITIAEDRDTVKITGKAKGIGSPLETEVAMRITHMLTQCQPDSCEHDPAPKITTMIRDV